MEADAFTRMNRLMGENAHNFTKFHCPPKYSSCSEHMVLPQLIEEQECKMASFASLIQVDADASIVAARVRPTAPTLRGGLGRMSLVLSLWSSTFWKSDASPWGRKQCANQTKLNHKKTCLPSGVDERPSSSLQGAPPLAFKLKM